MSTLLGCSGFCYCDEHPYDCSKYRVAVLKRSPRSRRVLRWYVFSLQQEVGSVINITSCIFFSPAVPRRPLLLGTLWLPDLLMWTIASMLTTALKREFWHLILLYPI